MGRRTPTATIRLLRGLRAIRMTMSIITTEQLSRRYGRRVGIDAVNLEIKEGEIFGFLGPNGAGKTTTIRLLLGFLRPTLGRAGLRLGLLARESSDQARSRLFARRPATVSVAHGPNGTENHRAGSPGRSSRCCGRFGRSLSAGNGLARAQDVTRNAPEIGADHGDGSHATIADSRRTDFGARSL